MKGSPIEFPPHLYPPEGAKGIDIRRACSVSAGSLDEIILRFVCPQGANAHFIAYGIYNDGLFFDDYDFIPKVNGSRIFPYHGTPVDIPGTNGEQQQFKIALGLGPNLTNACLINGEFIMQPGQVLTWTVNNRALVDTVMGVRMVGYFDPAQGVNSSRFGG